MNPNKDKYKGSEEPALKTNNKHTTLGPGMPDHKIIARHDKFGTFPVPEVMNNTTKSAADAAAVTTKTVAKVREHVNSIEDVRAAPMQRDCPKQAWLCTVGFCAHFVIGVVAALGAVSTQPSAFGLRQREGHRGNNMSLNDNVRDSAAQLFVAPAIILSGVDELCAQTQPATHLPTEPPSSEAVFLPTCASSHDRPPHLPRVMCDLVSHSVEPLALTYACSQPKPQDIHRELGLGAEYDNQRHARPLVGGVSCPPQFVSMFLAMQMTLPLAPSAAAAKTVVDAAESMEGR